MQSVRDANPNYRRYLFLVDKKNPSISCGDLFEVIEAEELHIDSFADMAVRYNVMELNTAVKPFAIEWLFDNTDAQDVVYLDPDIFVYRPLTELETALEKGAAVVVTPHVTKPLEDGKLPNDYHMLQSGVFNLGFIAVRRSEEAREFVRWWGRRLKTHGYSDVASSLFTDQKWIDLAPCFVKNLFVLRSHAYNVAYWNLMQRPVTVARGKLVYADGPLAFFHFSGLEKSKPTVVSKHQNRLKWKDIQIYQDLFKSYRSALRKNGWGTYGNSPYAYDQINGLKLSIVIRGLYRELYPEALSGVDVDDSFLSMMCNAPAGIPLDREGRITKLMHWVYRQRPDLQAVFALNLVEGIHAYRNWFEFSASREYGLEDRLANPPLLANDVAVEDPERVVAATTPNHGRSIQYRQWRKLRKWLIERL